MVATADQADLRGRVTACSIDGIVPRQADAVADLNRRNEGDFCGGVFRGQLPAAPSI